VPLQGLTEECLYKGLQRSASTRAYREAPLQGLTKECLYKGLQRSASTRAYVPLQGLTEKCHLQGLAEKCLCKGRPALAPLLQRAHCCCPSMCACLPACPMPMPPPTSRLQSKNLRASRRRCIRAIPAPPPTFYGLAARHPAGWCVFMALPACTSSFGLQQMG